MSSPSSTPDFFISYAQADREWAEWIATTLERSGHSTVVQAWDFLPGTNFVFEMQKATANARQTVVVLSPDYLNSAYATAEWTASFALDPASSERKLIPVRVQECMPEGLLKAIVFIDLVGLNKHEAAQVLLGGIKPGRQRPRRPVQFPVRKVSSVGAVVTILAVAFGAIVVGNADWSWFHGSDRSISSVYRVRAIVLDPQDTPVNDAKVWSSLGGEPMRVEGGWLFTIPVETRPRDGKLTIYASVASAFLQASTDVQLNEDRNQTATVRLARQSSGRVRGVVQDEMGRVIKGARVSVVGYGNEEVITEISGSFVLAAHAADGQQVQLHAERTDYSPVTQWHPAGDHPATLILERRTTRK